ncbi:conserved Plasmodium protein, unknown function [Babesia microti strain RI]|uniref:Uncharacterized protein n=1 Tax=Babesia microti (strain RI) TaxID=1133968 RepID=A0A1R4ABL1_BABMR|nr:conserved Plasmodium protein, unknown function [Babesia microti strain RI]SJK86325.1 conserved Plasmodium protein, unknown function [Babesia microti strain RI]|eukprot:XP_012648859.2 conserved Plasmodium protein, unknown function [Babesia microti strain RI]
MINLSQIYNFGKGKGRRLIRKLPREFISSALQVHMPTLGLSGDQDKLNKSLRSIRKEFLPDLKSEDNEGIAIDASRSNTKNTSVNGASSDSEITVAKNRLHKRLWNAARKSSKHWNLAVKKLEIANLPLDEVTGTLLIHGSLLYKSHQEALETLSIMKKEVIHPSLLRYNARLIAIHQELSNLGARPCNMNWLKVMRSSWLVASFVKGRRERFIQRNMGQGIHKPSLLWFMGYDPLLTHEKLY